MKIFVQDIWASNKVVINGWLAIPSGFSAEIMASCGFDSVTVDLQHGVQDYLSMVECFQAMQPSPVAPMARVPWNEPGIIGKVLDAGATGVICPMVNTKSEAEKFVAACKYPPQGSRSNGPIRAGVYGEAGAYQRTANAHTLCIPMIETCTAVDNLDAILDVEGIACVYVGPSDLGFSYGLPPTLDREEPEILKIYEKILYSCSQRKIRAGIHCGSSAGATKAIGIGFDLVTLPHDSAMMAMAAEASITEVRSKSSSRAM